MAAHPRVGLLVLTLAMHVLDVLFVVFVFLGLAELLLNGAVQLTEEPHFLTVLQEACRSGCLV